jgi:hypothetical protein
VAGWRRKPEPEQGCPRLPSHASFVLQNKPNAAKTLKEREADEEWFRDPDSVATAVMFPSGVSGSHCCSRERDG